MNFSILKIINRLLTPKYKISCSAPLWRRLLIDLHARGHGYHESGAFLLGTRGDGDRCQILDYLLYDDVDPHALDSGIVHLDGRYFGRVWDLCKTMGMTVVADVHTHPAGSGQSESDQAHPIISRAGHIALIIPRYAVQPVRIREVGMYRYLGGHRWESVPPNKRKRFFHIGS